MRGNLGRAVVLGGLVAGTIDVGAATLISGASPWLVLRYIAGGLLGRSALKGGWDIAVLGLGLQWAMSLLIAAIYVLASRRIALLTKAWIACGLAYGVGIYGVMNYVVAPLSALHAKTTFTTRSLVLNMAAMLLFGLIVAYFASRQSGTTKV